MKNINIDYNSSSQQNEEVEDLSQLPIHSQTNHGVNSISRGHAWLALPASEDSLKRKADSTCWLTRDETTGG